MICSVVESSMQMEGPNGMMMSFGRKVFLIGIIIGIVLLVSKLFLLPGSCGPDYNIKNQPLSAQSNRHQEVKIVFEKTHPELLYNVSNHRTLYYQKGLDLYLHTAFLDDRFRETIIRIFGMQKKDAIHQEFVCEWKHVEDGIMVSSQVNARRVIVDASWPQWSTYFAVTFDCNFPRKIRPPTIELATKDGQFKFNLQVEKTLESHPRKTIAACVKPMTGLFSVARLVEWFEILRMAGFTDIIMYETDVQYAARFVMKYYESIGVLKIIPFPYLISILQHLDKEKTSGQDRYAMYQQTYLVAMHDCLYRFRGIYENILYLDVDEILLPTQKGKSIKDVVMEIRKSYVFGAGYLFMTAWHFEEMNPTQGNQSLPDYLYMHKNVRASIPVDNQPKSLIVTDRAISLNFHQVLDVPKKGYSNEPMPWKTTAYLHHFRGRCDQKFEAWRCKNLSSTVREDPVLPYYKDHLKLRVGKIVDQLVLGQ